MNNKGRNAINDIMIKLQSLELDLEDILADEESVLDFSTTERYKIKENACQLLQETIDVLEEIV